MLPDISANRRPDGVVEDYGLVRKNGSLDNGAGLIVSVDAEHSRRASVDFRSGKPNEDGSICSCITLRVRNVLLTYDDLTHLATGPPTGYLADRDKFIAALGKLGKPVSP